MYYSTPEPSIQEDNKGDLQAHNDNLYHLDVTSGKYYSNTHSHASRDRNSQEAVQVELQQTIDTREDQTEVRQPKHQSLASPIHNVPMDQLLSEFESVFEP